MEEVLPKGDGVELGGLVGNLLAGLEGEEHGLEAVTKEEAGTQGSACLTIDHVENVDDAYMVANDGEENVGNMRSFFFILAKPEKRGRGKRKAGVGKDKPPEK